MKDPEMVMKFNELKKKIQSSILSGDKPKLSNDKIWNDLFLIIKKLCNERLNKNIKYYLE